MLRFSEISETGERLKNSIIGFEVKNIKPVSDISNIEAHDFWDDFYTSSIEETLFPELDIEADVYGRSEDEFTFDFDINNSDFRELLLVFHKENWEKLGVDEKKSLLNKFADLLGSQLDIQNRPAIVYYNSDPCDYGCYDPDSNTIYINQSSFDDPQEIVDTVAHEMRHAYQYERAQKLETYEDYLYAYNFVNYISPYMSEDGYVNFIDYQDQFVEAEARAFASLFVIEEEEKYNE